MTIITKRTIGMKKNKKLWNYGIVLCSVLFFLLMLGSSTPVKASSQTTVINTNGKTFYLVTNEAGYSYKNVSKLYLKTYYGNKLVASMSYDGNAGISYSLNYGNKLYFCVEDSGHYYDTYVYTIGKSGFRKEKNNLKLIGRKGKYAIAYIHEATDVAPNRYCLYNLSSKRCQYLGEGYGIRYFGKNIYYVRSYKNMKRAQVIRYSYNGSKRKVLKTLKSSWDMIGFRFVNKHKVWYHIYRSYPYRIVNRTASF